MYAKGLSSRRYMNFTFFSEKIPYLLRSTISNQIE